MKKPKSKRVPPLRQPHAEELDAALKVGAIAICELCDGDGVTPEQFDGVRGLLIGDPDTGHELTLNPPSRVTFWVACKMCNGRGTIET